MIPSLRALLGDGRVSEAEGDLRHYGHDWSRVAGGAPLAVAFPATCDELQALVRWAREHRIPLVPSGGRTGLSGGATAMGGEVVVSMERMRKVLAFDPVDRTLVVEAGTTTQQVQDAARGHGLFYPVDFGSRGSAQIGGNVATNAGGIKVLRYGMTRDWVAGLKVVTGTGDVLELNKGLTKNATGYDLRHLFIGSEGTLGFVVEATLRLTDPAPRQQVILVAVPHLEGVTRLLRLLRERLTLGAFEFFTDRALQHVLATGARRPLAVDAPYYVLAEFDAAGEAAEEAFGAAVADGCAVDGVVGQSLQQDAELWRLREGITESLARHRPYKNDVAVRVSRVPAFLERMDGLFARHYPGFEVVWFGHVGDGNVHVSVLPPAGMDDGAFVAECERVTEMLAGVLQEFGGTISAEHGIGLLKKPYLHHSRDPAEIALMRTLKRTFDPDGILNPGKLV